jgi:hypothetical protein
VRETHISSFRVPFFGDLFFLGFRDEGKALKKMVKGCAYAGVEGCGVQQPVYNTPGQTKGLYCEEHSLLFPEMVNVVSKPRWSKMVKGCAYAGVEGCGKQPKFNTPGQINGLYCKTHSLRFPGMVNVVSRKCAHEGPGGCRRIPVYNTPGQTKGLYCEEHSLLFPGMVNVASKLCAHEGCGTQPVFNAPGQTRGLYCKTHSLPGMVNVVANLKVCAYEGPGGCVVQNPNFNAPGQTKGLYCKEHKHAGMVSVTKTKGLYKRAAMVARVRAVELSGNHLAQARAAARLSALEDREKMRKDFANSDRVRDQLRSPGIRVEDSAFTWTSPEGRSGTYGARPPAGYQPAYGQQQQWPGYGHPQYGAAYGQQQHGYYQQQPQGYDYSAYAQQQQKQQQAYYGAYGAYG